MRSADARFRARNMAFSKWYQSVRFIMKTVTEQLFGTPDKGQ